MTVRKTRFTDSEGKVTTVSQVLDELRTASDPCVLVSMRHVGLPNEHAVGVGTTGIQSAARHAQDLWGTGVYEAQIVAAIVDRPAWVTTSQMEEWAGTFDSWAVCDFVCSTLFDKTPFAVDTASAWSSRDEEFVKRAGFVLMASLAIHDKVKPDAEFESFFPLIEAQAWDDRNYVRKAVNWALRQIGKRNLHLNSTARACATRIQAQNTSSARWIATDALRELQSPSVHARLERWIHDPGRPQDHRAD
ncbi:MAG: DNA alkylation repair protein [Candidatus Cryosericum sp.]